MTVSSSSQWDPLGSVHMHRACGEKPKLRLQSCPESRATVKGVFYQAAGMMHLVNRGRAHRARGSSGKFWRISEMWGYVSFLLFDEAIALWDLIGSFFQPKEDPV